MVFYNRLPTNIPGTSTENKQLYKMTFIHGHVIERVKRI